MAVGNVVLLLWIFSFVKHGGTYNITHPSHGQHVDKEETNKSVKFDDYCFKLWQFDSEKIAKNYFEFKEQ